MTPAAPADVRVLQLVTRLNIGGPARHVLDLARGLGEPFAVEVAAGRPPAHEGELLDAEIPVHPLPLTRALRPVNDAAALLGIRRLLRRFRPAILHTHMAKAGALGRVAAAAASARPVTVHTFHGHVLEGYFRPAVQRTFLSVERALARRTDALVVVSDRVRTSLLALGVGRPEQYHVIPLGLDPATIQARPGAGGRFRAELGVGPHEPLVAAIGRLTAIKDLPLLLGACRLLEDVHVVLVGEGEERAALEDLAARLGMAARTHFTGWRRDVAEVLAAVDVVVLTSRNEGTPLVLVEAAAAGVPVVATSVGGVPDVVVDGVTGLLVRSREPEELVARLGGLLADAGLRARLGSAAGAHARQRFDRERSLAALRALYLGLVGREEPH